MNRPASDPDRATMEAARWLVALDNDPDDADLRARIEAWRAADPANEFGMAGYRLRARPHGRDQAGPCGASAG